MIDFSDLSQSECDNLGAGTSGGVHRIVGRNYVRHRISDDLTGGDKRQVAEIFKRPEVQEGLQEPKTLAKLRRYYGDALPKLGI